MQWLKRLSPPALCALVAIAAGSVAGASAVHGLKQNSYGPPDPPALFGRHTGVSTPDDAGDYRAEQGLAMTCQGCSERDLGYRWAVLAEIRTPDQCPDDSWGFRRGCLDYAGGV